MGYSKAINTKEPMDGLEVAYDNTSSGLEATNIQDAINELTVKASKPTAVSTTLTAPNWDSTEKTYSFESTYPSASYDIEIDFDYDNGTSEQYEAYCASQLGGSATSNKVKAMGDVPTIDIPIVIYVTNK